VRLTSLTLQGFKSFGHRTTIEFSPGVTAVVGPNGSGKSNLLDALKWVTGGGRAREFRAEVRTDLIFHGAEGKRGVSYTEVEVELSDGRRALKVRRDLDRSGASRLRLDGRLARFIDVDEALAGSGLGTAGVAMIGQGEIAGVLMADPATLLRYVAEAAGVARLAGRREQTQARLEGAQGHLLRLEDVLVELRERIEHLRHEAQVAERHAQLARETLQLRVTTGHARVAALTTEVDGLRRDVVAAEQRILAGRDRLTSARDAVDAARERRTEAERDYREALAAAERAQGVLALARAGVERASERRAAAERARQTASDEASTLAATPPPVDPGVDLAALQRAVDDAEAHAGAALGRRSAAEAALAVRREALRSLRARHAELLSAWSAYRARAATLERERGAVDAERAAAAAEAPTVDATATERASVVAREAHEASAARLEDARAALQAAHEAHATAHADAAAAERVAERARGAYDARRGYGQGSRVALTAGIAGVLGSVADLLRVAPEHQAAIGGALGRRAEYVVVDQGETAERVLAEVRRAGGWVTLLPLDLLRPPREDRGNGPSGVLGRAVDVIEVEPRFRAVAAQLLANTYLVPDLATARAIARAHPVRPRLVTLEGDVIEPGGAISGGRRTGASSVLGLGREVEATELDAARAADVASHARASRAAAEERVRDAQGNVVRERARAVEAEATWRAADEAVRRHEARMAELDARTRRLEAAAAELTTPEADEGSVDLTTANAAEAEALTDLEETRAAVEAAVAAAAEARREAEVGAERRLAYEAARVAHERSLARAERLREAAAGHAEEMARWAVEETQARARREAAEAALPRDLDVRRLAFDEADATHRQAEARLRTHTEEQARAGDALEAARLALARREAALEVALDERAALPAGVEPLELSERIARSRWREAEAALEALGPVNQRAAVDHAAQAERLAELEREGAQAAEAVDELASTLATIDAETNERLNVALEGLRDGFAEHVRQLFGPTAVGAIDVEREGQRPTGLRIRLQPPGKRTESLNLLSVGERTMGALAFLFALMAGEAGSLPIAVLDEVDAPLDEANISRFCHFVDTLSSRGTQFVLITHQKATFEIADTLWGVTSEDGVSRVFSIRRDDPTAVAAAGG